MPNWCQNILTIENTDSEKIDAIQNELLKKEPQLFNSILPRPASQEENWYDWNVTNWGTKWDASIYNHERIDDNVIEINFDTAWGPPIALYDHLFSEGYDITAYYNEEGMAFCGMYEFGSNENYEYANLSADEMRDQLPQELDEKFNISEYQADREAEEELEAIDVDNDDEEDSEPEYEMTDWFSFLTKPIHEGLYEVKTISWPFPQKVEWKEGKWLTTEEVCEWRGLTQKEHDLMEDLNKLLEDFDKLSVE